MWPFSSYSFKREGVSLPHLTDTSPEELRWRAYSALQEAGGQTAYQTELERLHDRTMSVRRELMNIRGKDVQTLVSSEKIDNFALNKLLNEAYLLHFWTIISSLPSSSLQLSQSATGATPSLFGALPSSPPSTSTVFPSSSSSSTNPFQTTPQQPQLSLFTIPHQQPAQDLFGGSKVTGNLFGGQTPTTTPSSSTPINAPLFNSTSTKGTITCWSHGLTPFLPSVQMLVRHLNRRLLVVPLLSRQRPPHS